ncbi:MAG: L,D-transpeptidase [Patescibacteria group bacterium]
MKKSSLEHKTIRPGSLNSFAYYSSDRHPVGAATQVAAKPRKSSINAKWLIVGLVVLALGWFFFVRDSDSTSSGSSQSKSAPAVVTKPAENHCASNTLDKLVLVSVTKRHLWACEGSKTVHNAPVITGIQTHESTLTPVGTYKIYAKVTDTTLTGTDETGSWSDPVQYWMPFLDNQFGTYGFHDATWRSDKEFGKVDPYSEDASHGCVELPLASAKWLYEWAVVGTTVTVEL